MDEKFAHVYKHAVRVARNVNVNPTMPRVAGRQVHRCNTPADNPEQYYQRIVAVPLINHIQAEHPVMSFRVKYLLSFSFSR